MLIYERDRETGVTAHKSAKPTRPAAITGTNADSSSEEPRSKKLNLLLSTDELVKLGKRKDDRDTKRDERDAVNAA